MKNKIGMMFISSAIALAMLGGSYAMWSETIYVNGSVDTGKFDLAWSIYPPTDNEAVNKDFSHAEAYIDANGVLQITIINAYPCITYTIPFDITNVGTMAAHFYDFTVNPIEWKNAGIITIIPQVPYPDITVAQIHPGESWYGFLQFHFTNEDGFAQDETAGDITPNYSFSVTITGHQYNEGN